MKNKVLVFIGLIITIAFVYSINSITFVETPNREYESQNYVYTNSRAVETTTKKAPIIKYEKNSYSCLKGQYIDTTITLNSGNPRAVIKGFGTNDSTIATVTKNPDMTIKCYNCVAVRITCKEAGNVNLYARSSDGAIAKVPLEVRSNENTVSFSKSSYTCNSGDSFTTMIRSSGMSSISYYSRNTAVATIEANQGLQTNCINCVLTRITCKQPGTTRLVAKSSLGATTSVRINVR